MKLQPGDYVSTQNMTEEQYHAIAKRFIEAGAHPNEHCSYEDPLSDWIFIGWMHGYGFAHWNNPDEFGTPNRLLTIEQILSALPEWDGTGLPPVGAVVSFISYNGRIQDGTIIAYVKTKDKKICAMIQYPEGGFDMSEHPEKFRPIRSDRDKAIDDMMSLAPDNGKFTSRKDFCGILYDAGYRKQQETKA